MGSTQSTDSRDRKSIEFYVFDKSFALIEKYVKNKTNGLRERFRSEYQRSEKGLVDWYQVLDNQISPKRKKLGYIEAIKITGDLLKSAKKSSNRSDRQAFTDIYRSVDTLITRRDEELDPKFAIFGFVIYGGEGYNKHKPVVDAWKAFK